MKSKLEQNWYYLFFAVLFINACATSNSQRLECSSFNTRHRSHGGNSIKKYNELLGYSNGGNVSRIPRMHKNQILLKKENEHLSKKNTESIRPMNLLPTYSLFNPENKIDSFSKISINYKENGTSSLKNHDLLASNKSNGIIKHMKSDLIENKSFFFPLILNKQLSHDSIPKYIVHPWPNKAATLTFTFGLLSWILLFASLFIPAPTGTIIGFLAIDLGLAAFIIGIFGVVRSKHYTKRRFGFAIAGLIMGSIVLLGLIIAIAIV